MGLFDAVRSFLTLEPFQPVEARSDSQYESPTLDQQIAAIRLGRSSRPWTTPTIADALGVPAIQRAVSLIAGTTGMLSVQGYRAGVVMSDTPPLLSRPDPFRTPYEFYSATAYNQASRGEFVWWIASRDGDGLPSALVVVPLAELTIEENPRDRLRPDYTWGKVRSTRYSPANRTGEFVHHKYPLSEPLALRGKGPLQLCGAATSVTVEAQEWAANFYAYGGNPSVLIKKAGFLSPLVDDEGLSEADRLRMQWVDRPNNVPRVVDDSIESVTPLNQNTQGAQMLDARQHQTGDAARMFGIPGSLLEYQQAGSSLTYQNLEGEFTKFVRTCLQPFYLEPIEQALSDLLPRSTAARFAVDGFLRADVKTRFEVYGIGIDKGIIDAEEARRSEGLAPGNVEFAPIPFAPPAAVPSSIPSSRAAAPEQLRCDGMRQKRRSGITRLERCNTLLNPAGPDFVGMCRKCKKVYPAA